MGTTFSSLHARMVVERSEALPKGVSLPCAHFRPGSTFHDVKIFNKPFLLILGLCTSCAS